MSLTGALARKEHKSPKGPVASVAVTGGTAYGRKALEQECAVVSETPEGERNTQTNTSAFRIGQLVPEHVNESEARAALIAASKRSGLEDHEAEQAVNNGLSAGKENPRVVTPLPDRNVRMEKFKAGESEPPSWMFDNESEPEPSELPTSDAPLKGLESLSRVALMGRARILELAAKPIDYVWVDIAPPGTITVLAGAPGEGKTTLLFLVLAARANLEAPLMLLGREVRPAPPGQFIVLIEGEHSEASASRKLVKTLQLLAVDDMALDRVIVVARKAVTIGSPEWRDVVTMIQAGLVSDLGIDTLARVAPSDPDSEREQVAVFDAVAQALESAPDGVAAPNCWTVAHTRKNGTTDGLAEVSGSVQRTGQADSVLLLKAERADGRVVSSRVTFAKLREDPDEYPEPVEFTIAKDADGLSRLRCDAQSSKRSDDVPLEARIVDLLKGGPKTKSALADLTKRSRGAVDEAIGNLFQQRAITTKSVTVKGKERTAFSLRTDTGLDTGLDG